MNEHPNDWRGYRCVRDWPHGGPCALVPRWWNLPGWVVSWGWKRR